MGPDTESRRPATPSDTGLEAARTSVGLRPASHFRGRRGYSPTFLGTGRFRVDLPKMPQWMEDDTVRLISNPEDFLLHYTHFSIVLSASRGLAIYTAVNIDGRTFDDTVDRDDRDPDHPNPRPSRSGRVRPESLVFERAGDKWFYDGRIDTAAQLQPDVLDEAGFDFGHVMRRQDPVWGDERAKRIANDDSFYMTNCSPQHKRFNRVLWEDLESKILEAADENDIKITVFTGPVLDPRDPEILGLRCPVAFWKVLAYKSDGKLESRAFLMWQRELVEDIRRRFEALDQLDRVEQYQVPVREIARLTSLDFGPLFAADELQGQPRRRIDERTIAAIAEDLTG
jgi:endonuclease G